MKKEKARKWLTENMERFKKIPPTKKEKKYIKKCFKILGIKTGKK